MHQLEDGDTMSLPTKKDLLHAIEVLKYGDLNISEKLEALLPLYEEGLSIKEVDIHLLGEIPGRVQNTQLHTFRVGDTYKMPPEDDFQLYTPTPFDWKIREIRAHHLQHIDPSDPVNLGAFSDPLCDDCLDGTDCQVKCGMSALEKWFEKEFSIDPDDHDTVRRMLSVVNWALKHAEKLPEWGDYMSYVGEVLYDQGDPISYDLWMQVCPNCASRQLIHSGEPWEAKYTCLDCGVETVWCTNCGLIEITEKDNIITFVNAQSGERVTGAVCPTCYIILEKVK